VLREAMKKTFRLLPIQGNAIDLNLTEMPIWTILSPAK
jgi:hypothetical protein